MDKQIRDIKCKIGANLLRHEFRLPEGDEINNDLNRELYKVYKERHSRIYLLRFPKEQNMTTQLVYCNSKETLKNFEADWLIADFEAPDVEKMLKERSRFKSSTEHVVWLIDRLYEKQIGVQLIWA